MTQKIYNDLVAHWTQSHDSEDVPITPTLTDKVQFAHLLKDQINRYYDVSKAKTTEQFARAGLDEVFNEESKEKAAVAYNDYQDYNLNKTLRYLWDTHTEGLEGEELDNARNEFKTATGDVKRSKNGYAINSEWLTMKANSIVSKVQRGEQRKKEFLIDSAADYTVKLPAEIIGNTADMVQMVYDAPKYFLDDEGDEIYHKITRMGSLGMFSTIDKLANLNDWAEYEGHLKENPHLANSLEFLGELALTLPLEGLVIAKMAHRVGRKKVLKKLDSWKDETANMVWHRAKRLYANTRLGTWRETKRIGMDNVIKQGKRDLYYATAAMAGVEGSFQFAFSQDWVDEENNWVQGARIGGMLLGGALFPTAIHRVGQHVGAVPGGTYTKIKDLKWHATTKDQSIDSYLVEVMGYEKSVVDGLASHLDKLRLANVTRQHF